ncbi:hypothetical protein VSS93_31955, partial [Pseudomonas syringae pv. tagetis]
LGGKVQLMEGGVERIQDWAVGHLVLSITGSPYACAVLLARARQLAPRAEVLGYGCCSFAARHPRLLSDGRRVVVDRVSG